jgi:hypothetical protein
MTWVMEDRKEEHWEKVFSTSAAYRAEIMKALLEEEDIVSVIVNKQDRSYLIFGEIEVYVKSEDVLKAKLIAGKLTKDE